jgi:hypothetical protein
MRTRLRGGHAAEAVRLWLQSGLETTVSPTAGGSWPEDDRARLREREFTPAARQAPAKIARDKERPDNRRTKSARRTPSG